LGPVLYNIFTTDRQWDWAHPQQVCGWHQAEWCGWHTWWTGCHPEGPGQAWKVGLGDL